MRWTISGLPGTLARAGRPIPSCPRDLTPTDIRALVESGIWALSNLKTSLLVIRWFAHWAGNPIAEDPEVWLTPSGAPTHRRWITADQLRRLWMAAEGRERLLVALMGFNGLRRIEVLRLHVRDLDLALPNPTMHVLGKGRDGGKWRTIPVQQVAYGALVEASSGRAPNERLYTLHERTADHDLRAAATRARLGIPVSGHDLRRSFRRIAYQAGVSLVDLNLKYLYGHESVDMTAHYIGQDMSQAARGLAAFGETMAAVISQNGV